MPTLPRKCSQSKRSQQTYQQRTHQEVATSSPSLEELLKRIEKLEDKVAKLEIELIVTLISYYHRKWMTSTSIKEEHV